MKLFEKDNPLQCFHVIAFNAPNYLGETIRKKGRTHRCLMVKN